MTDHGNSSTELTERLASGIASVLDDDDVDTSGGNVRVVPIGEGDVTQGGSGKKTYWDIETLRQGVEDGAFDGAKLLKGQEGDGHKKLLDQADPDDIIGAAGTFEYREGVGPVSENSTLVDEHIEKLAELGLVDVSPDMLRVLGEYDDELGAYRVERIIDVPYITVLDYGASSGSITPTDEQLASFAVDETNVDALAETLGVDREALLDQLPDDVDESDDLEQLERLFTMKFRAYGDFIGQEFVDDAVDSIESVAGLSATASSESESPELIVVVDRDAVESVDELNGSIVDALADTPFDVGEDFDWVERVAFEGLEASRDTIDPEQLSDERAESRVGRGTTTPTNDNMADPEELQEQLAEVRAERNELDDELDELREQLNEKDETIDEYEDTVEQLEAERDELADDLEPLTEMLAGLAAEDSRFSKDQIADRFDTDELVETLAVDAGWSDDDDETPIEVVREQLAGSPEPRGDNGGDDDGPTTDAELEQAEQLAGEVMTASDRIEQNGQSDVEYLRGTYDVDPVEFDDVDELRETIRGDGGD